MVGIFSQTGFFEWSAVRAYKASKGNVWRLVLLLCVMSGLTSAVLDNVTTMLLLTVRDGGLTPRLFFLFSCVGTVSAYYGALSC
jgi:citrate transporter